MKPPLKPFLTVQLGSVALSTESGAVSFEVQFIADIQIAPSARIQVIDLSMAVAKTILNSFDVPVKVTYGWVDSEGATVGQSWNGRVVRASMSVDSVSSLVIECIPEGLLELYSVDRQARRRGSADAIVTEIAQESGVNVDIDGMGVDMDKLQLNASDIDFIRRSLLPYVNMSSKEPYAGWVENGTLHIKKMTKTGKTFVYGPYVDDFANIISLEAQIDLFPGLSAGGEIIATKVDPNTKQVVTEKTGGQGLYNTTRRRVMSHAMADTELRGALNNIYGWFSSMPLQVGFTVLGNVSLRPWQTVNLQVYTQSGKGYIPHPISGEYLVFAVTHRVSNDGFYTDVTGFRGL